MPIVWLAQRSFTGLALFPAVILALVLPILLPLGATIPALKTSAASDTFLEAIWGVDATVVTIAVAVVVFTFQTVRESRFASVLTLREFASQRRLVAPIAVGIGSLLITGLVVLYHVGRGAPGGWAGSYAATLDVVALMSLPVLLFVTVDQLDDRALQRRRLAQLRSLVEATADDRVVVFFAEAGLHTFGNGIVALPPERGVSRSPGRLAVAEQTGEVVSIRLRALSSIVRRSAASSEPGAAGIELFCRVGQQVSRGEALLQAPPEVPLHDLEKMGRTVKIRARSPSEQLVESLHRLSDQAHDELEGNKLRWYRDTADAYVQLFSTALSAWHIRQRRYSEVGTDGEFFRPTWIQDAIKSLGEHVKVSCRFGNDETRRAVVKLLNTVAVMCLHDGTRHDVQTALGVVRSAYDDLRGLGSQDGQQALSDEAATIIVSANKAAMHAASCLNSVQYAEDVLDVTLTATEQLGREMASVGDAGGFAILLDSLAEPMAATQDKAGSANDCPICRVRAEPKNDGSLRQRLRAYRLSLCIWLVARLMEGGDHTSERAHILEHLVRSYVDLADARADVEAQISALHQHGYLAFSPWTQWVEWHANDAAEAAVERAFVAVGMLKLRQTPQPGSQPDHQWPRPELANVSAELDATARWAAFWKYFGIDGTTSDNLRAEFRGRLPSGRS